jgi:hypothetical protein
MISIKFVLKKYQVISICYKAILSGNTKTGKGGEDKSSPPG